MWRKNTEFSILNAVSSEDEDSCSSDDSDGDAAMSETPDDVIFSSKKTDTAICAQRKDRTEQAVLPTLN